MPKKTTKRNDFVIPNDIAALFGSAPTLKTEDDEIYWNCMERFVKCVEPQDVIEWLWVKDVVDLSWEILRLRRFKIDLVEIDRENQNAIIEWQRERPNMHYILFRHLEEYERIEKLLTSAELRRD